MRDEVETCQKLWKINYIYMKKEEIQQTFVFRSIQQTFEQETKYETLEITISNKRKIKTIEINIF